jgi:hypothetical protein
MGLLGSLLSNPVVAHVVDMGRPERRDGVEFVAGQLSWILGIHFDDAASAVRAAVSIGEGPLLDSDEGRAVILHEAAEIIARGGL